jgi:hypothetical protein
MEKADEMNPAHSASSDLTDQVAWQPISCPALNLFSHSNMAVPPGELVMLQELVQNPVHFNGKSIRATGM